MKISMLPIGNPRKLLGGDIGKIERAINNGLDETSLAVLVDFNVTTQTHSKRAKFQIRKGKWYRDIYTDDFIYSLLDAGTPPHRIEPRNASHLRFQTGYNAKTMPRIIASKPGGKFGPTVYSLGVNHPGFEAREFSKTIAVKWTREFPKQMDRAILAALS